MYPHFSSNMPHLFIFQFTSQTSTNKVFSFMKLKNILPSLSPLGCHGLSLYGCGRPIVPAVHLYNLKLFTNLWQAKTRQICQFVETPCIYIFPITPALLQPANHLYALLNHQLGLNTL